MVLIAPACGILADTGGGGHFIDGEEYTPWDDNNMLPSSSGNYYLTEDVTLSSSWATPQNATVKLDLNGFTVTGSGSGVISCVSTLYLYDSSDAGTGTITGCNSDGNGAIVILKAGENDPGKFFMYGGNISGNVASQGAGVKVQNGEFHMHGGRICNNTATGGGSTSVLGAGVCVDSNGKFFMYGGKISGNTINGTDNYTIGLGGGVYVAGKFTMSGGEISENSIPKANNPQGGGVYAYTNSEFTMSGGKISGNSANYGGGIVVQSTNGITISGGEISCNSATSYGGGIYLGSNCALTVSGGVISGNKADVWGGAICAESRSTTKLYDCLIKGNTSGYSGPGFFSDWSNYSDRKTTKLIVGGTVKVVENYLNGVLDSASHLYVCDPANQNSERDIDLYYSSYHIPYVEVGTGESGNGVPAPAQGMKVGVFFSQDDYLSPGKNKYEFEGVSPTAVSFFEVNNPDIGLCVLQDEYSGETGLYFRRQGFSLSDSPFFYSFSELGTGPVFYLCNMENGQQYDSGFVFDGWYDKRIGGNRVAETDFTKGGVYYAHWKVSAGSNQLVVTEPIAVVKDRGVYFGKKLMDPLELQAFGLSYDSTSNTLNCDTAVIAVFADRNSCMIDELREMMNDSPYNVLIGEGCTFNMKGGKIIGNLASKLSGEGTDNIPQLGGGVAVCSGTVNMTGGEISGNHAQMMGGGIFALAGTVNIEGGKISSNVAEIYGGGIGLCESVLNLSGGTVEKNSNVQPYQSNQGGGGGIAVMTAATLFGSSMSMDSAINMTGGTVSENMSYELGGGISVQGGAVFNFSSGLIANNSCCDGCGGGVGVEAGGKVIMTGGTIEDNSAYSSDYDEYAKGGGVFLCNGASFAMTGGKITGNSAEGGGGGVYLAYPSEEYSCLAEGTLITMADGSKKRVEELENGELIRAFDHETGEVTTAEIYSVWKHPDLRPGAFTLSFSNGAEVTVVEGHSFFERESNKYVCIEQRNVKYYIGHEFYSIDDGEWVKLESARGLHEAHYAYNVVTKGCLNCIAEGMLSNGASFYLTLANIFEFGDNLRYNQAKKAVDIEKYGIWSFDNAKSVPQETYDALNLKYMAVAIGKGMITAEDLTKFGVLRQKVQEALKKAGKVNYGMPNRPEPSRLSASPEILGLILGGSASISGNVYIAPGGQTYANNVCVLSSSDMITLGTGTVGNGYAKPESMKIGVVNYDITGQITKNGGTDSIKYFFVDDPEDGNIYYIDVVSGHLEIIKYEEPDPVFKVIVSDCVNGVVYASKSLAGEGDTVVLEVLPNADFALDTLNVSDASGRSVTLDGNTFEMPDSNVTVTATFKGKEYTVTVIPSENGTVTASPMTSMKNGNIELTVTPDTGYELDALTVKDASGTDVPVSENAFNMPDSNVTVTAAFKKTKSPDPDPNPGPAPDGGGSPEKPQKEEEKPAKQPEKDTPSTPVKEVVVRVSTKVEDKVAAVEEITRETIERLSEQAAEEVTEKKKERAAAPILVIDVTGNGDEVSGALIPKSTMEAISEAIEEDKFESLSINVDNASVKINKAALKAIVEKTEGDVVKLVVDKTEKEHFNKEQQAAVEDMNIINSVDAYLECNGERIKNFGGGNIELSIATNAEEDQNEDFIHVYYLSDDGTKERFRTRCKNGVITFTTGHFSDYIVVYDESDPNENYDVSDITTGVNFARLMPASENVKKKSFTVSWNELPEADGYIVLAAPCKSKKGKSPLKKVKTVKDFATTSFTLTGLKKGTFYKFKVKAYKTVKDERKIIAKSVVMHTVTKGGKYTDIGNVVIDAVGSKTIKGKNASFTIKKGAEAQILLETQYDGKVVSHEPIRFESTDKTIASVSKGGSISGLKKGTCKILVYAQNGVYKEIKLTVEK